MTPNQPIQQGSRAVWENRHELALAKLGGRLLPKQTESDWSSLLVNSGESDRHNDDFIEAHIYGSITIDSVQTMREIPSQKKRTKDDALDIKLALVCCFSWKWNLRPLEIV